MQQKVADQQEALEIAMKLETTPVGDNSGISQIHLSFFIIYYYILYVFYYYFILYVFYFYYMLFYII